MFGKIIMARNQNFGKQNYILKYRFLAKIRNFDKNLDFSGPACS